MQEVAAGGYAVAAPTVQSQQCAIICGECQNRVKYGITEIMANRQNQPENEIEESHRR